MKLKENVNILLPREKLSQLGPEALSDAELLAVLLRTGTQGHHVLDMARELLERFGGSLLNLCNASVPELCSIQGMGKTKSLELCAAFALSKRMALQRMAIRPDMRNPQLIANYMRDIFRNMQQEAFYVLMLDTQMRLMRIERVTMGLVDRSLIHAREVFRSAIRESCSSIIICHNHPSGHIKPSQEDIRATKLLNKAGDIIGIRLIDHIIVGGQVKVEEADYFSFLENGLIEREISPK